MADKEREDLVARFFDGAASADDQAALEAVAAGSPEARRDAARQLVVDRVLRQMGKPPLDPGPILEAVRRNESAFVEGLMRSLPAAPRPRRTKRRAFAWTAGALIAAAAGVTIWIGPRVDRRGPVASPTPRIAPAAPETPLVLRPVRETAIPERVYARLEGVVGTTRVLGPQARPLPRAAGFPAGASLTTLGPASGATAVRADGTRLRLGGDAVLVALGEDAALLARGPLAVEATGSTLLATPHGRVEIRTAARVRLDVGAPSSRLEVDEGSVRLWRSGEAGATDVVAGQYALLQEGREAQTGAQARGGRVLLVVGETPLRLGDKAVAARLDRLGYEVRVALPGDPALETLAHSSRVVLISSTTASPDFTARLREAPVPVVTWERSLYDDLGMTAPCDEGGCGESPDLLVLIKDPTHPLAAGMTGIIRPSNAGPFTWGTPGFHAAWVATVSGQPDRAVIFAYERGARMPGLVAPARRVGFFLGDWSPGRMRDPGWRLFDAAVEWAAGGER